MVRALVLSLVFLSAAAGAIDSSSAKSARDTVRERSFACRSGDRLLVRERANGAAVRVGDTTYDLRPKSSSLGRKFASAEATLIIDGSFAVFVASDRLNLRECYAQAN